MEVLTQRHLWEANLVSSCKKFRTHSQHWKQTISKWIFMTKKKVCNTLTKAITKKKQALPNSLMLLQKVQALLLVLHQSIN
jgi:hypothetical protein